MYIRFIKSTTFPQNDLTEGHPWSAFAQELVIAFSDYTLLSAEATVLTCINTLIRRGSIKCLIRRYQTNSNTARKISYTDFFKRVQNE